MALTKEERVNFETLKKAFANGDAALIEGKIKATGERVAIVCAVGWDNETQEYLVSPFGHLCPDNPFDYYEDPTKEEDHE